MNDETLKPDEVQPVPAETEEKEGEYWDPRTLEADPYRLDDTSHARRGEGGIDR